QIVSISAFPLNGVDDAIPVGFRQLFFGNPLLPVLGIGYVQELYRHLSTNSRSGAVGEETEDSGQNQHNYQYVESSPNEHRVARPPNRAPTAGSVSQLVNEPSSQCSRGCFRSSPAERSNHHCTLPSIPNRVRELSE